MSMLLRRRGVEAKRPGLLLTATSFWVPKHNSSGDLVDQRGSSTLVDTGVVLTNDGAHHYAEMRVTFSDYLEAADAASLDPGSGDFSIVVVLTPRVDLTGTKIIAAKRAAADKGWNLFSNGAVLSAATDITNGAGGAVIATGGNLSVGTRATIALVRASGSHRVILDGTAGTPQSNAGDIDNNEVFRLNRGSGATTAYSDQDLYGVAWFKGTALTDAQTVTVGTELLAADTV